MPTRMSDAPQITFNRSPDVDRILSVLADIWGREHGAEAVFIRSDNADLEISEVKNEAIISA